MFRFFFSSIIICTSLPFLLAQQTTYHVEGPQIIVRKTMNALNKKKFPVFLEEVVLSKDQMSLIVENLGSPVLDLEFSPWTPYEGQDPLAAVQKAEKNMVEKAMDAFSKILSESETAGINWKKASIYKVESESFQHFKLGIVVARIGAIIQTGDKFYPLWLGRCFEINGRWYIEGDIALGEKISAAEKNNKGISSEAGWQLDVLQFRQSPQGSSVNFFNCVLEHEYYADCVKLMDKALAYWEQEVGWELTNGKGFYKMLASIYVDSLQISLDGFSETERVKLQNCLSWGPYTYAGPCHEYEDHRIFAIQTPILEAAMARRSFSPKETAKLLLYAMDEGVLALKDYRYFAAMLLCDALNQIL